MQHRQLEDPLLEGRPFIVETTILGTSIPTKYNAPAPLGCLLLQQMACTIHNTIHNSARPPCSLLPPSPAAPANTQKIKRLTHHSYIHLNRSGSDQKNKQACFWLTEVSMSTCMCLVL